MSFGQYDYLEKGYPPITNFSSKEYGAQPQNFSIVEDERGFLYFGNNGGIVQYDGVNFRKIETKEKSVVRSIHISKKSKEILIGAATEIGKLVPDSIGRLKFSSLNHLLPDTIRNFTVWNIEEVEDKIYFQTEYELFVYQHDSIQIIEFENALRGSFEINGSYYLFIEDVGFRRLMNGVFVPIPFGNQIKENVVSGLIQLEKYKLLLATAKQGFFVIETNSWNNELALKPFKTDIDFMVFKQDILDLTKISEDQISVSTSGGGVFILNNQGKLIGVLDEKSGLKDLNVNASYKDSRNRLWMGLSNGIAYSDINNPISHLSKEQNLEGSIEAIERFNGDLYCATHSGVYKLKSNINHQLKTQIEPFDFELVSTMQCWDLLSVTIAKKKILLGGFNDGVYEIKENGEVILIAENYPWKLYQSKADSTLIYIGHDLGLGFIKYKEGRWIVGKEENDFGDIRSFAEIENKLWAGAVLVGESYGLQNISVIGDTMLSYNLITVSDTSKQLPPSEVFACEFQGEPLFGIDSAIFTFDSSFGGFKPFGPTTKSFPGKKYYHRLLNENDERLWAITDVGNNEFEFGYFEASNDFEWNSDPFKTITDEIIHALHIDDNGIVWLGGPEGLYRYEPSIKKEYKKPFKTHIREVIVNRVKTIFGGAFFTDSFEVVDFQPEQMIPALNYEQNNLTFEFAAFTESGPSEHLYQFRLIGLEEKWSPPSSEPKAVYTNLEPGEYTFQVKSKNIYDVESGISTYQFTISPPWYETSWYYGGQFGFFGLLVFFTVYINRSKRDSEYTAVITFIALITVFEFILFLLEPYVETWFGGIPIFKLVANIILAISLNPVEYWVRGMLKNKKEDSAKEA